MASQKVRYGHRNRGYPADLTSPALAAGELLRDHRFSLSDELS
jgi:hypothetical protein